MNDMTRPQTASGLSEDIGDVLSAIRRLIAEDEALDFARDRLAREKPPVDPGSSDLGPSDPGEALAARFGGEPALARRMVRDSRASRDRTDAAAAVSSFTEHPLTAPRQRLIADAQVPPSPRAGAALVARREAPTRRDAAAASETAMLVPLRLGDSDRVDHPPAGRRGFAVRSGEGRAAESRIGAREDNDFGEAFGAKARMRPEPAMPAPVMPAPAMPEPAKAAPVKAAPVKAEPEAFAPAMPEASMPIPAWLTSATPVAAAPQAMPDSTAASEDFWATYLQSDADDEIHQTSLDLPQMAESAGCVADQPPLPSAMSIPAYPEEEAVEIEPAPAAPDQRANCAPETELPPEIEAAPVLVAGPDCAAQTVPDPDYSLEAGLQDLIREIIQEELHGELGQRFSRNLRAVIRREVAAAIDEHLERM